MGLKKKWLFSDYYDTSIILLALISVVLVLLGFTDLIDLDTPPYSVIDFLIWLIFVVDYSWRLVTAKAKLTFISKNIFDLLAILPLNAIFTVFRLGRVFRLARLTKLVKLSRLLRVIGLTGKLERKLAKFLHTNGLIYILYVNTFIVLVGSAILSVVEDMAFSDSLWWALVTVTTVGYGDVIPSTIFGKWIAVLLMVVGIGTISMLTSALTNFFVNDETKEDTDMLQLRQEIAEQKQLLEKQRETIEELHQMLQELVNKT